MDNTVHQKDLIGWGRLFPIFSIFAESRKNFDVKDLFMQIAIIVVIMIFYSF